MDERERYTRWMEDNGAIATRQSLLSRLKDWQDQESWRQFFDTYWRLIYKIARKAGLSEVEAQEVVQETVISMAKKIGEFRHNQHQGAFKKWLIQVTEWRIGDQFRKRTNPLPMVNENEENVMENIPDPASLAANEQWEQDWRQNIMEAALDRLRTKVPAKHFQAFDLYVTRRWDAGLVARTVGISHGQVYLVKFKLMKLLRAEIKRLDTEVI